MVRALIANVKAGQIRQGASTITQQVVKNFLLTPERTFDRKVQEIVLARRLEQALSKREILELYLNEIYLGHGCYGIEEASRFYFGKGVADINVGQAAILAGLPKAPSRDSPIDNPEGSKKRQRYVLQQMVRLGWATARDARAAMEAPLEVMDRRGVPRVHPGAEEFVDLARAELVGRFGEEAIDKLGATVTTTVDLRLQRAELPRCDSFAKPKRRRPSSTTTSSRSIKSARTKAFPSLPCVSCAANRCKRCCRTNQSCPPTKLPRSVAKLLPG